MSWGKGITITLVIFIAMISSFVYLALKQDYNLVTKDYYEESLDYDAVQQRLSNCSKLEGEVFVHTHWSPNSLVVELPEEFRDIELDDGYVYFYNPTDDKLDLKYDLEVPFLMTTENMKKGKWMVEVDWEVDGKGYRHKQAIFL